MTRARTLHALVFSITLVAVALQLVLVVRGSAVLAETHPPSLPIRLLRFVAYFTIQSNVLVLASTAPLVRDPSYDGPSWRILRAAALVGICVTGVVHFVLLRPLLSLHGADAVADKLLHLVVPVMTLAVWLLAGPRSRTSRAALSRALAWPLAWLAVTLGVGATTGWFPYPFLDYESRGWGSVVVASAGITALFLAVLAAVRWWDQRPLAR